MQLIHFSVELKFAEKNQLPSRAENVYEALSGKKPEKRKVVEPDTHVSLTDKRVDVRWRFDRCRVILEDVSSLKRCVETVLFWLNQIDKAAPMGGIDSTKVVTYWLLPTPSYDFASLVRKYREKMIISNKDILEGVFDCSVMFDADIGNCRLYHQSGAMERQQLLSNYLFFKPDEMPEVFLFLFASVINNDKVEYSKDAMHKQLSALFNHCMSHSNAFGQIWKEVL
ncbi:hypothetical protein MUP77_03165 [Candidatus Bathyarchaeota archaeon]|nr:hypothetical protein [Candidatus Bathyarchaeota archaeon]